MKFSKLLVIFATLSLMSGVAVASEVKKGDKCRLAGIRKGETFVSEFDVVNTI